MAQSLASPPEEGKRKPPSRQVFCWDAPGFVKNTCGLETQQKIGLFPISKGYPAISVYIKQKISKLNFQSNKAKLVHPSKPESFQQESPPQKKNKTWVCGRVLGFTAEPLRSPGASSESSAANLARTGTKPQPWWHGDGSGHRKWSYPYHPCMVHLSSTFHLVDFMANI